MKTYKKFIKESWSSDRMKKEDVEQNVEFMNENTGTFVREYEPGEYDKSELKYYTDIIKKAGGKKIKSWTPNRSEPNLTIEFEGNVNKVRKALEDEEGFVESITSAMKTYKEFMNEARQPTWRVYFKGGPNPVVNARNTAEAIKKAEKIAKKQKPNHSLERTNKGVEKLNEARQSTMKSKPKGRPRGAPHIENVRFWDLSKQELQYIVKDAKAAMRAYPGNPKNTSGPGNYADQVNDAATVMAWRKKKGINEGKAKSQNEALAVDTKKAKLSKMLSKTAKSMGKTKEKQYSYKDAKADFKYSYGKDAGEVLWYDGYWLDSNIGEVLKAKERTKPAGVKEYKRKLKEGWGAAKQKRDQEAMKKEHDKYRSKIAPHEKDEYDALIKKGYRGSAAYKRMRSLK